MLRAIVVFLVLALGAAESAGQAPRTVPQVQDLWWGGPQESGWGISIVQHDDRLFCALLVYDDTAHPTWFVMSGGAWNADRTAYTGDLYWPRAPGSSFSIYNASRFQVGAPVGQATIEFSSSASGTLRYVLTSGYQGEKQIQRLAFGPPAQGHFENLTDMWWGGVTQAGWAAALVQQGDSLFLFWLTYLDQHPSAGDPTWFVMPSGTWTSASTYEGPVYRPVGTRWLGLPTFDPNRLAYPTPGSFKLTVLDASHSLLEYQVLGTSGVLQLTRFPF